MRDIGTDMRYVYVPLFRSVGCWLTRIVLAYMLILCNRYITSSLGVENCALSHVGKS